MIHLKDNFQSGAPISQVPASWFNSVAKFINGIVQGRGIKVNKKEGCCEISLDDKIATPPDSAKIPTVATGTAVDKTDDPPVLDSDGETWSWKAGGPNGIMIDAYYVVAKQTSTSSYKCLQRARLLYSADGLLVSAEGIPDRVQIKA